MTNHVATFFLMASLLWLVGSAIVAPDKPVRAFGVALILMVLCLVAAIVGFVFFAP